MIFKLKKFCSNQIQIEKLFNQFIENPIVLKNELHHLKFLKFQREIGQINRKIDNEEQSYDLNLITENKEQRINFLFNEMNNLQVQEQNFLIFCIKEQLKKKNTNDKTIQNQTNTDFQRLGLILQLKENQAIPYLDQDYQLKQKIINILSPLGQEKFQKIIQSFGGVQEQIVTQQEQTQEVKKEVEPVKQQEQKKIFDVQLCSFNASDKIKIIKDVRSLLNLGLKEVQYSNIQAKELVEKTPVIVSKDLPKDKAEELAEKLKALGCEAKLL